LTDISDDLEYIVCRQYLLMKAAVLVFCTEGLETQVAASSLIIECKFSVHFLMMHNPPTASSSAYYRLLHNRPNKPVYDIAFALEVLCGKQIVGCEQTKVAYVLW